MSFGRPDFEFPPVDPLIATLGALAALFALGLALYLDKSATSRIHLVVTAAIASIAGTLFVIVPLSVTAQHFKVTAVLPAWAPGGSAPLGQVLDGVSLAATWGAIVAWMALPALAVSVVISRFLRSRYRFNRPIGLAVGLISGSAWLAAMYWLDRSGGQWCATDLPTHLQHLASWGIGVLSTLSGAMLGGLALGTQRGIVAWPPNPSLQRTPPG